ncbi:hypothetical protein FHR24_001054 [Wenyingzhuangia heitensis]|uniref:Lipoprotein n=1 Tax=Wenyingzhuangia heitensis TaxID=1487859 RepID=A0ABX0U9J4_9FLAO|nr:hypothetical protein [Wenyingzhuangia heitensis]NIJ44615.1 hypothetical protein [Wenyingzhuangia heitensis]
MIKKLPYFFLFLFIVSCSGLKTSQKHLAQGNYDQAIEQALTYLQSNRYGKKAPDFHQLLFESYQKAVAKDKRTLDYLSQDTNPESLEQKFNTLLHLENRQNKIRPLMPIDGFTFKFDNYTNQTLSVRDSLSDYLYYKANDKLISKNKQFIREAHEDFKYLQSINSNYKDVPQLINNSKTKGTDYVLVAFKNKTGKVIPKQLANTILDLSDYNLDNYWINYLNSFDENTTYDYVMEVTYNQINLSPERIKETLLVQEKEIVDGKEYVLDEKGNVKKDKDGNDVKKDKLVKVTSTFHQFLQSKNCTIKATARFLRFDNQQTLSSIPLNSEFIFEHYYASQKGDQRALTDIHLNWLSNKKIPFPTNNQMILDTSNDVKRQLQSIITNQNF